MVFSPKLSEGIAFNQPVQQPSAMEAIAGLFNFGFSTVSKGTSDQPKMTEDEKFALAVRDFEEAKGATFKWDRKGMREFIFNYPQFTPQAKAYAENLGVMTTAPEEVARDSAVEWFGTTEGMTAVVAANGLPPEEREAYLAGEVTKVKQQEAEILKIERNIKELELQGTLDQKRWDAIKPTSKDFVDNTISSILGPIFQEVQSGVTVEVTPKEKAALGIRYDTVDINNINAVLADAKLYLENSVRGTYLKNFGTDTLPSEEWKKEVFGTIDGMIEVGKQFDTPQEQLAVMQALIDTKMYRSLDANGVAVITRLAEVLPADTLARLLPNMAEFDSSFMAALADNGSVLTTKGIQQKVADGSKADAEALASDTIKLFEKGFVPEFFTLFKESAAKSGYSVVDETSFRTIVGTHTQDIIKLSNENPEFKIEFQDWLNSDVQQTISLVRENLPANLEFSILGNKATVRLKDSAELDRLNQDRSVSSLPPITEQEYIDQQLKNLPDGLSLNTINTKIATLGLLGPVGKEVQESLGILNQNAKPAARETERGRGRGGRRKVTPEEVISGLKSRSIPTHIAEAFAMNIQDESGFRTDINEANPIVEGSRGGYGLIQWTGPRRKALEAFAAGRGVPVDDLEMQLDFLVQELGGTESVAWQRIQATTTREEAAVAILKEFLRPAEEHQKSRAAKYTGGAAGFEARSGTTGASPTLSLDSSAREVPTSGEGRPTASTESLQGTAISYDSPEVQQIIEKAQSAPEEAIRIAKEVLAGKPMDPAIKSLIEALVRIGER